MRGGAPGQRLDTGLTAGAQPAPSLPTPPERREIIEIIEIYTRRGLRQAVSPELMQELVQLSDGFAGSDLESAVREVAKEAYLRGDDVVTPEQIEHIRAWGRERAVPASGQPIGGGTGQPRARRQVLS